MPTWLWREAFLLGCFLIEEHLSMSQPTITARHCLLLHCGITNQLFDCFLIEEPTLPLNQYVTGKHVEQQHKLPRNHH